MGIGTKTTKRIDVGPAEWQRWLRIQTTCLLLVLVVWSGGLVHAADESTKISIVTVYDGMAQYANAVAADPAADRRVLWQKHVIDLYWNRCAEGGEYIDFAPSLKKPYADIEFLRKAASVLQASSVQSLVRSALEKSGSVLPSAAITACVMAADSSWTYLRAMNGVGGFTAGAGKIWLTILPEGQWLDWVAYATAHEYHHSVWTARHGKQNPIENMTDYLVFEGRADSFAHFIYPQQHAPWTKALTKQQEKAAWEIVQRNLNSTSPDLLQNLMFGGTEGVSRWAGYTIGFNIVQDFLTTHPDLDVNRWAEIEASELFKQSSYSPER